MTRDRLLGQARADLVALPDLVAELARLVADRTNHDVSGYSRKVVGSPAPLSIPVVHLVDQRHKPGWAGEDPRIRALGDRYGITPTLETWTRALCEELGPERPDLTEVATVRSECAVLVEWWSFIAEQQWAVELAEEVTRRAGQVRAHLGIRPEYKPTCRKCQSTVIPVDSSHVLTSWESAAFGACTGCEWTYPKGPAMDALAQVQDPLPLKEISGLLGLPVPTLHRWYTDGLIVPVEDKRRGRRYDLAAVRAVATHQFGRRVG